MAALLDRARGRLLHRRRVDLPRPAQPRLRDVRRRHDLVPHAVRGADRPGSVDRPPALHRPAAARRLVLPAELGADPRAPGSSSSKTDWLSPLINLVWLSIALLAAWCVGRPYKVGPATLVAAALVLDSGVMIETQPGEGRNDIMGLAFLIAFAAFLINGHQRRAPDAGAVQDAPETDAPLLDKGPLIMAGIAAGLAVSVKLPLLVPVVAITVGMVVVSGRGRRWSRPPGCSALSAFVVGGYWYLRAAIKTGGNPIPQIGFGPLHLPRPDQMPLDPRPRFAVAHYLFNPTIYRKWFFPQLDERARPALAADPDRRRRRRRLHRGPLPQPDPAGDRRRRAADRASSTSSRR